LGFRDTPRVSVLPSCGFGHFWSNISVGPVNIWDTPCVPALPSCDFGHILSSNVPLGIGRKQSTNRCDIVPGERYVLIFSIEYKRDKFTPCGHTIQSLFEIPVKIYEQLNNAKKKVETDEDRDTDLFCFQ